MVRKKGNKRPVQEPVQKDSVYFLKLVLYIIAGAMWLRFQQPIEFLGISINALPVGLVVGLLFVRHEKLQIDRKIEYAVLLIATVVSAIIGTGIVL